MTSNRIDALKAKRKTYHELEAEVGSLRFRLEEALALVEAIRNGELDTLIVPGDQGDRIYTLKGVDDTYRSLLEDLNEGALSVTSEGTIMYCNRRFSEMAKTPIERLLGTPIQSLIRPGERRMFNTALRYSADHPGSTEFTLQEPGGSLVPAIFSMKHLVVDGMKTHCIVVTDITERRRSEDALRKSEAYFRELYGEAENMRQELQWLSREVLRAQEEERTRISREIHDEIGQALTAISVNVNKLNVDAAPPASKTVIRSIEQLLEKAADSIHQLSQKIHPGMIEDLGLIPAVRSLVRSFRENMGLEVRFECPGSTGRANLQQKAVLYRIVQESLTNVVKHAGTRRAVVTIRNLPGLIELHVVDGGKGFTATAMRAEGNAMGLGLLGMRERARALGGECVIRSRPGKGTKVIVRLPVPGAERKSKADT